LSEKDGNNEVLMSQTFDGNHNVLSRTDEAGKTTFYTYNDQGQILTMTTPKGETTQYSYQDNLLISVTPPQPGAGVTYTYDSLARVQTKTDSVSGTLTYHCDDFDRVISVDYPDGTHENYGYTNLDMTGFTDRQNRTTSYLPI